MRQGRLKRARIGEGQGRLKRVSEGWRGPGSIVEDQ